MLAIALLLPYLSARLDPDLKTKYDFEYALSKLEQLKSEHLANLNKRISLDGGDATAIRRSASEAPFAQRKWPGNRA